MTMVSRSSLGRLFKVFNFLSEYTQDLWIFVRYNGYSPFVQKNRRLFYGAIIDAHSLEKGLALGAPRPLFGRDKINALLAKLQKYDSAYSPFPTDMAKGALSDYWDFHNGLGINDPLLNKVSCYLGQLDAVADKKASGARTIAPPRQRYGSHDAILFLTSRTSCRMFKADTLPTDVIEKAVVIAQSAPSQCNRQASKAHFYQNRTVIDILLSLQGGARGFSDTIGNLFVITSEITAWGGPQQRNQLYVDGALFSLNLMLAFHALGIGSCPLNLAVVNRVEKRIKLAGGIPRNERVIMMIAVGETVTEGLKAARSPRRDVLEIMTMH